jgi:hypothetical protein
VVEILQLAYEYDVKYLFKRALLHFETYYPTVIDGERVYDPSDDAPGDSSNEDDGDDAVVKNCDLVALKVALEVGALWNIPCIMYDCCTTDLAHLLDLSEWEGLSADQKLQILVAHDKQKSGTRVVSEFLLADHPAECVSNDACNLAKLDWLRILDRRSREGEDSDPLLFWGEGDWEDMGRDFCEVCLVHFEESYRKQRGVLWNGLPESLGLTKWEDMLKMKDEISKSK